MSCREQLFVLQTIKGMKEKIARDAIGTRAFSALPRGDLKLVADQFLLESDSDSEIQAPTNRGNKLKKKAKFVREGKLGPPTGPSIYKEARCSYAARVFAPSIVAMLTFSSRRSNMVATDDPS